MVNNNLNIVCFATINIIIPDQNISGKWLSSLSVGDGDKYIGRADSIAVRMPNNTVTLHLIDQTGPVAVTSANPTGEADTTHHVQVLSKLGRQNVSSFLISDPSENCI